MSSSSTTTVPPTNSSSLHLSRRIQHAMTGLILLAVSYIIPPYPIGVALLSIATVAFYIVHLRRVHDEAWDSWYLQQFGALLRDHERGAWEEKEDEDSNNDNINTLLKSAASNGTTTPKKYTQRRRRKTVPNLPGACYFLLGTTLSTLFYNTSVARTALLVLSIADPAAGLVGSWFGIHLPAWNVSWEQLLCAQRGSGKFVADGGPSVIGSIACALTTILCTYAYIPSFDFAVSMTMTSSSMVVNDRVICLSLGSRLGVGLLTAITEALAGKRNIPVVGILLVDDNLLIPMVVGALIHWLS